MYKDKKHIQILKLKHILYYIYSKFTMQNLYSINWFGLFTLYKPLQTPYRILKHKLFNQVNTCINSIDIEFIPIVNS